MMQLIYRSRFIQLLGLFLLLLVPLTLVEAKGDLKWMRWEVEADFRQGIDGVALVVTLGGYDASGQSVALRERRVPLACRVVGDATFNGQTGLVLRGEGFVACELPSVVEQVAEMTNEAVELPTRCSCKRAAAWAELMYDEVGANPIFYHEDVQFGSPLVDAGEGARVQFDVGGETAVSDRQLRPLEMNRVDAAYWPVEGMAQPTFWGNGHSLGHSSLVDLGSISNEEAEIYFGYNPVSGELMTGRLMTVWADPGCFGMG